MNLTVAAFAVTLASTAAVACGSGPDSPTAGAPAADAPAAPASATQVAAVQPSPTATPLPPTTIAPQLPEPDSNQATALELPPNGATEAISSLLLPELLKASRQLEELGGVLQVPSYIPSGLELLEVALSRSDVRLRYGIPGPHELIYIDFTQRLPYEAEATAAGPAEVRIRPVGDFRTGGALPSSVGLVKYAGFQAQFTQGGTRIEVSAESHRCVTGECRDRLAWCTANSCPEFPEHVARAIITSTQPVIGGFLPANGAAASITESLEAAIAQREARLSEAGSALYLPTYLPEGMTLIDTHQATSASANTEFLFYRDNRGSRWFYLDQDIPALTKYSTLGFENLGTDDQPIWFTSLDAHHRFGTGGVVTHEEVEPDGAFRLRFRRGGTWFAIEAGNGTCPSGDCAKWSKALFVSIIDSLEPDGQDPASE